MSDTSAPRVSTGSTSRGSATTRRVIELVEIRGSTGRWARWLAVSGSAVVLGATGAMATPAAAAGGDDVWNSGNGNGGTTIHGGKPGGPGSPGSGGRTPSGPSGPVYEYFYVPSCPTNRAPTADGSGGDDALCMGAVSSCPTDGDIRFRVYRREVGANGQGSGPWDGLGTECRGADEPTQVQPQPTREMVIDAARQAAPSPSIEVEPGTASYVNIPNNYAADAPETNPTVTVLGQQITLTFFTTRVTWDFGDGTTATGAGVPGAAPGAAGAVEHGYSAAGRYDITASTTVGVRFTLPDGQQVDEPEAFTMPSDPVTLPVGEIQALVDSVR